MQKSYRFKCRNKKCGAEFHRYFPVEEFDKSQYGINGWSCFNCGYPKMMVIKSKRSVADGFKPGFQRNIMKYCETYTEYKAWLKKMNLFEFGYEDLEGIIEKNNAKVNHSIWNDKLLKKAWKNGFRFSDREAAAAQAGIYE